MYELQTKFHRFSLTNSEKSVTFYSSLEVKNREVLYNLLYGKLPTPLRVQVKKTNKPPIRPQAVEEYKWTW